MKKLTFDEFQHRSAEVMRAMRIYTPHITDNITLAFDIYLKVLAEDEEMARELSTSIKSELPHNPTLEMEFPLCPDCDVPMMLLGGIVDIDKKHWNSAFMCSKCGATYYSDKTPKEWYEELKEKKDES